MSTNTFDARGELEVGSRRFEIFRLDALQRHFDVARLPFSLKVLLENLLRTEGNGVVRAADIEALATWDAQAEPSTGIVHQVNLEYLARVVFVDEATGRAYPDTLVGTDSHTTMVNGLGVLGWGVGGIEAEAAMLGQPMSMLIPQVIGVRLYGQLPEGATATDLVLTVAERLREKGVVGTFVEFYGAGLASLPLADRATIGNMSPEFGSTCAIFPIDAETVRYLEFTGRPKEQIELVEAYARKQRLWHDADSEEPIYSDKVALDLGEVVPSLAGPKRPQDRISLTDAQRAFRAALEGFVPPYDCHDEASAASFPSSDPPASSVPGHADLTRASASAHSPGSQDRVAEGWTAATETERRARAVPVTLAGGAATTLDHGHVVIAAITSCTNTSNPSVMIGAGILALAVVSVLSGNRNFEGRIHAEVKLNYLASPPLCVAYALAGTMDVDIVDDPLGEDSDGNPVFLRDLWPSEHEVAQTIEQAVRSDMFRKSYGEVFDGDERWNSLAVPAGDRFAWAPASTYVRLPPYFEGMPLEPEPLADITGARALVMLGDSVTTDHISPAGSIRRDGPADAYLQDHDVKPVDFNSYGSRRGNHEVMMRGTFANVRLRNLLAPGTEGGLTRHLPDGEQLSIYDAAMRYRQDGVPLVALGGKEYGSGSSRDWAAKGTLLLGVRAVIAESYERIHRSNLVGMGVLPLQFAIGDSAASLGLDGEEEFSISGVAGKLDAGELPREATVRAGEQEFTVRVRIDTPKEAEYFRHGGILQYVLRQLLTQTANDDHQGRAGARGSRGDHD